MESHFAIGYQGGYRQVLLFRHVDDRGWVTDKVICDMYDSDMVAAARKALARLTLWQRIKIKLRMEKHYEY